MRKWAIARIGDAEGKSRRVFHRFVTSRHAPRRNTPKADRPVEPHNPQPMTTVRAGELATILGHAPRPRKGTK